ncbi:MAG: POTRA domain-containing protein, partial [Bryobacteraceae bacterium]
VRVDEGDSYKLGAVRIEGGPLAPAELMRVAELKEGDLFDGSRVQAAAERIQKRLRRDGYLRAAARIEQNIREVGRTVEVTFRVDAGPQYTFDQLVIRGLDLIAEAAVKKMWTLKPGQPFNADYPDYFLTRIREEGMLENLRKASASLETDDVARTVRVTLEFR